jgi:hypothetical protein
VALKRSSIFGNAQAVNLGRAFRFADAARAKPFQPMGVDVFVSACFVAAKRRLGGPIEC